MSVVKKLSRRGKETKYYYVVFGARMPGGKKVKVELSTGMQTRSRAEQAARLLQALWEDENRVFTGRGGDYDAADGEDHKELTLSMLRTGDLEQRKNTSDFSGHKAQWNSILRTHPSNTPLIKFEPAEFFSAHIDIRSQRVEPQTWRREIAKMKNMIKEAIRLTHADKDLSLFEKDKRAAQLRSILDFYPAGIRATESKSSLRGKIHSPIILERFFAALPQNWRNQYLFARNTGIRSYELRRMTYDMVKCSEDGTWVAVLPAAVTKTKKGRDVTLNVVARNALISQRETNPTSQRIWDDWDQEVIQRAVQEIGYKDSNGRNCMIYLRDMRHEFATNATYMSGDHKAVRDMLGHKSFHMTERYLHSDLARKKAVTNAIEEDTEISKSHISLEGNHELPLTDKWFKSQEKD